MATVINSRHRTRQEIMTAILEAVRSPTNQNKILFSAYLNYRHLQDYLQELQKLEMIHYNMENNTYVIQDKGIRYLKIYYRLQRELNDNDAI